MNKKAIQSVFFDDPEIMGMLNAHSQEELVSKLNETPQSEVAILIKGNRGSCFLGVFDDESELPAIEECSIGDYAIVGEQGTLWYII